MTGVVACPFWAFLNITCLLFFSLSSCCQLSNLCSICLTRRATLPLFSSLVSRSPATWPVVLSSPAAWFWSREKSFTKVTPTLSKKGTTIQNPFQSSQSAGISSIAALWRLRPCLDAEKVYLICFAINFWSQTTHSTNCHRARSES